MLRKVRLLTCQRQASVPEAVPELLTELEPGPERVSSPPTSVPPASFPCAETLRRCE